FEGEVKLIDFGIAKSRQQLTETDPNIGFGKFGYMAPEQLVRGRKIDRRADLYSIGVILYELLIGDRMVVCGEGEDYRAVARSIAAGSVAPPSRRASTVAPELDPLVMRAIAADPRARFQSAEELRDAVQRHLYALNPTISSDRLAKVIQELFGAEQNEDRQLLAQARAMDLAPFREELNGGRTHPGSFVLAARFEGGAAALGAKQSKTDVVELRQAARVRLSRLALAAGSLVALASLGGVAVRTLGRPRALPTAATRPPPAAPALPEPKPEPPID